MTAWAAGGIGAAAALAGGALGFAFCRRRWPRDGHLIDGGAILGVLFGFPIGYAVGLAGGLAGLRAAAPFDVLPAAAFGLLPFALLAGSVFVFRRKLR
jgi:hypothetical protein